jgi:hypothetical protein
LIVRSLAAAQKRGFRKKQIACRKECEDADVVTPGGRRVPRRGVDTPADDNDDWDDFNVIEGLEDEAGKRPLPACVARCMSPYCYDLEYNRPVAITLLIRRALCELIVCWCCVLCSQLEPGEVDERYDFFRKCFTLEAAESRKRDRLRIDGEDDD